MNKILNALLIICAVALAGCVETKDEYIINPDGSGKVIHEVTMQSMDLGGMLGGMGGTMSMETGEEPAFEEGSSSFFITEGEPPSDIGVGSNQPPDPYSGSLGMTSSEPSTGMFSNKPSDPQAQLRNKVKEILEGSRGVDVWKDVSYSLLADGRIYFKGTAYFPDINKLSFQNGGFSDDSALTFTRDLRGRITIELKSERQEEPGQVTPRPPQMTDAEVAAKVQEARMGYSQTKMMMASFLSTMKIETILHLPGDIVEISNFEQLGTNTARIVFEGGKMLEVMDMMMQDDLWLAEQIRSGRDPKDGPADELAFNEMLFGQRAPLRVVVQQPAGMLPFFDYNAEVTAAQANYESMLTDLGLDKTDSALPAVDEVFSFDDVPLGDTALSPVATERSAEDMKVKVGGMRLIRYSDFDRGIMPLGRGNGYTLSLIVELPEPVVKVSGGNVEKAVTDGGGDLLPKQQWDREIRFAKLSKDRTIAVFDIDLLVPQEGTTVLEELSGTLEYLTASGSKQVDLGAMDFKAGAKGGQFSAVITAVEDDPFQRNATMLSLRLNLANEEVESVEFYAQDGTKLEVGRRGYMSMADTTTLEFSIKSELPDTGRIVLNVYDQLQKSRMPFQITKILLSGQPVW